MLRVLVCVVVLLAPGVWATEFGPWSSDARHPAFAKATAGGPTFVNSTAGGPTFVNSTEGGPVRRSLGEGGANPFTFSFRVWSELLTRIDGPRCAHRPSCSVYAYQALKRYGLPLGVWMALNRLMRGAQSSVLRTLPVVMGPGGIRYLDPL